MISGLLATSTAQSFSGCHDRKHSISLRFSPSCSERNESGAYSRRRISLIAASSSSGSYGFVNNRY
jgi:hypothetical protein